MAQQIQGVGGEMVDVGGKVFKALRTQAMPLDHGVQGHFGFGTFTGIIAAGLAGGSELFQFRWTDTTRLAVILAVRISASVSTTFFAAGVPAQLSLVRATGWTVQGTGGTGITPAALMKKRSSMASSVLAANDMRIATTAALGAGTKTLDAQAICTRCAGAPITASLNGTIVAPGTTLFRADMGEGQHPIVLAANEGLVVTATVPGTGTWTLQVEIDWAEVAAF